MCACPLTSDVDTKQRVSTVLALSLINLSLSVQDDRDHMYMASAQA